MDPTTVVVDADTDNSKTLPANDAINGTPPEVPSAAIEVALPADERAPRAVAVDEILKSVCLVKTPDGLGTGFVVLEPSLVATNFHVIAGAKEATVQFQDGPAIRVVGFLAASAAYDLAVLRLEKEAPADPLRLRGSDKDLGVDVFAVGAPKGLAGSVSKGVVSARRRWSDLRPLIGNAFETFGYDIESRWVQTDAAINQGNSGGPLCLADGTVIAVNTLASPGDLAQNVNFAIDGSHLVDVLQHLSAKPERLSSLPDPRTPTGNQEEESDSGRATLKYWTSLARVMGKLAADEQRLKIRHGHFRPARSAGDKDRLAAVDDEQCGKTKEIRIRRVASLARQAGMPFEAAMKLDYQSLQDAVLSKKAQQVENARQAARLNAMSYATRVVEERRIADEKLKAMRRKIDDFDRERSGLWLGVASIIEDIPKDGVDPAVVAYAIASAKQSRRLGLAIAKANDELGRAIITGENEDYLAALTERNSQESAMVDLSLVEGNALRQRLSEHYHMKFGDVVSLTDEEQALFNGDPVEQSP